MKIAIVTNFFYEGRFGGTEKYCYELMRAYQRKNIETVWLCPNFDTDATISGISADGIPYIKFAAMDVKTGDKGLVRASFLSVLEAQQVTVVHFHEFGGPEGSSPTLVKLAKQNNYKCFVTYHLIEYTCATADLHYLRSERCNGFIDVTRCTRCLMSHKLPDHLKFFSKYPLLIPPLVLQRFSTVQTSIAGKIEQLKTVATSADKIISLTDWFKDVLTINGVPTQKIATIRQGYISAPNISYQTDTNEKKDYCYLGRVVRDKGIFDVIAAFMQKGMERFKLDIYGPDHSFGKVAELIKNVGNIEYKGIVAQDSVPGVLSKYKTLIVPSIVAEMASLTIVDAHLVNTSVIVSDVPGNVEMANNYGNSLAFPTGDNKKLAEMIIKIEAGTLLFPQKKPQQSNTFDVVADEHLKVYAA